MAWQSGQSANGQGVDPKPVGGLPVPQPAEGGSVAQPADRGPAVLLPAGAPGPTRPYHGDMQALMYGVEPEVQSIGETDNRLLRMLARTPTRLIDIEEPGSSARTGW